MLPLAKVGPAELIACDQLVLGSWIEGHVVAGVHPARAARAWLERIGRPGGKAVALFCTSAVSPKRALEEGPAAVEAKGGRVVASAAFNRRVVNSRRGALAAGRFADDLVAARTVR